MRIIKYLCLLFLCTCSLTPHMNSISWLRSSLVCTLGRLVILLFVLSIFALPALRVCAVTCRDFTFTCVYRVSQKEWTKLRESVPYVELYRYNPKHLYPKLNGYGDNGHRKVWASGVSTYCTPSVTPYSSTAHARQLDTAS